MTYEYKATIVRWIDGDTVVVDLDLGFHVRMTEHIRLLGYDAPETGKPGSVQALARANELAPVGSVVLVRTYKAQPRSFTRWLADVYPGEGQSSLAVTLAAEGLSKADFV